MGNISDNSGNIAIGNNNKQKLVKSEVPDLPGQIRSLVDQIRRELGQAENLPDREIAEEALTEITEVLEDGAVPSRSRRIDRALEKLRRAVSEVSAIATPLAQLGAAIGELLRAKP